MTVFELFFTTSIRPAKRCAVKAVDTTEVPTWISRSTDRFISKNSYSRLFQAILILNFIQVLLSLSGANFAAQWIMSPSPTRTREPSDQLNSVVLIFPGRNKEGWPLSGSKQTAPSFRLIPEGGMLVTDIWIKRLGKFLMAMVSP